MKTKTLLLILLITTITNCKKKEKKQDPVVVSTTDTTIAIKISLYPVTPTSVKQWSNPNAIVIAKDYQSASVSISAPTFSSNGSAPCSSYNWANVGSYNLVFKKNVMDTILLRNYLSDGSLDLQAKYTLDFTVSPPVLKWIKPTAGKYSAGVVCGENAISFGYY